MDVGCGQGTQAVRLARLGWVVTGVEPSVHLRAERLDEMVEAGVEVELLAGELDTLPALLGDRHFELVCAHGLLMYLDEPGDALAVLSRAVGAGGRLSVTFRNAGALAARPAFRRDWAGALRAFEAEAYANELGAPARADRLDDVVATLNGKGW